MEASGHLASGTVHRDGSESPGADARRCLRLHEESWESSVVSDWKPIRRTGKPDADAIRFDERSGRIELHFPLSATPPAEWTQFLDRSWKDPNVPQPKVRGQTLVVWSKPSEAEFADWAKAVDGTIESANHYYREAVLEPRRRDQAAAQRAAEERESLLEEARGWAEGLEPPSRG